MEFHVYLILLMWQDIYENREKKSFMGCKKSFISMKLIRLDYLVFALDNHAMKLCIETSLISYHFVSDK